MQVLWDDLAPSEETLFDLQVSLAVTVKLRFLGGTCKVLLSNEYQSYFQYTSNAFKT